MRHLRLTLSCLALLMTSIHVGCEGEPLVRVPADGDFSTSAEYAQYDREMRTLAGGQADSLSDPAPPSEIPQSENEGTSP